MGEDVDGAVTRSRAFVAGNFDQRTACVLLICVVRKVFWSGRDKDEFHGLNAVWDLRAEPAGVFLLAPSDQRENCAWRIAVFRMRAGVSDGDVVSIERRHGGAIGVYGRRDELPVHGVGGEVADRGSIAIEFGGDFGARISAGCESKRCAEKTGHVEDVPVHCCAPMGAVKT